MNGDAPEEIRWLGADSVCPRSPAGDRRARTPLAGRNYAELRAYLERRNTPIGPKDMLTAAQALVLDLAVAGANFDEFSRLPNVRVVNWLDTTSGGP